MIACGVILMILSVLSAVMEVDVLALVVTVASIENWDQHPVFLIKTERLSALAVD